VQNTNLFPLLGPVGVAPAVAGRAIAHAPGDDLVTAVQIQQLTRRYVAEGAVEAYVQEWIHLRTTVSFTPETVAAWGRGY